MIVNSAIKVTTRVTKKRFGIDSDVKKMCPAGFESVFVKGFVQDDRLTLKRIAEKS